MKHGKLSILFPYQDEVVYQMLPESTWHDLGLDSVSDALARRPQEAPLLRQVMCSMTPDPRVAAFRADVFEDILAFPEIQDRLMKLLEKVKMFYDYGVVNRREGDEAGIWDLMHRLEEYHDYIITVESIRECLTEYDLKSEGLTGLRNTVEAIYRDNGFAALKKDVEAMRTAASQVQSVTLGVNLNDRFEAVSLGLVSVNSKPFTRSGLLKNFLNAVNPRDDIYPEADWNGSLSYHPANADPSLLMTAITNHSYNSAVIHNPLMGMSLASVPSSDSGAGAMRQMDSAATVLVSRLVRKLRDMLGNYVNISVREIADLIPELTFYTRWAEYIRTQQAKGWKFCKPQAADEGVPSMNARGFYNLKLIAGGIPEQTVVNDLTFDAEKRVYVLTGANRGGKTTATQALGQLFLLGQCGIRVPGTSFSFTPADCVLTHFPADEDRTMDLGRLGEECSRFKEMYTAATQKSLLLLNETFSTTSFEEGYYIAVDAVKAILKKNTRTVYNTHLHKLAMDLDTAVNEPAGGGKAVSLVSRTADGKATFRIEIAPPEGKSFAREIAEKYGVTLEKLISE